jgi:hypothetical protein
MTYLDEDGEAFKPVCEVCEAAPASVEVTAGSQTFDACDDCVPVGRFISARTLDGGRRQR